MSATLEERQLQKIASTYICAVCHSGLVTPYSPILKRVILVCFKDRSHQGYVRLDPVIEHLNGMRNGENDAQIDEEIQQYQIGELEREGRKYGMVTTETKLARYQGVTNLTEKEATHILETCWPHAPRQEVIKAALLCKSYGLNPLMKHVFILGPFKNRETGSEEWSVALGIKANRLLAARKAPYTFVDGPRVMTEEEQIKINGKVDNTRIWAICVVGDPQGNHAPGYGWWNRSDKVKGETKGNTPENMAFIRAERGALDRLRPGEMPDAEVVDERYMPPTQIIEVEPEKSGPQPDNGDHVRLMLRKTLTDILTNDLGKTIPQSLEWLGRPSTNDLTIDELNFAILCGEEEKKQRAEEQAKLPF